MSLSKREDGLLARMAPRDITAAGRDGVSAARLLVVQTDVGR
jgi:hypothetical protein